MAELQAPLLLYMENAAGEEVALQIEPEDNFQTFLDKAKSLLDYEIDINSITRNQPVSLTDNVYQFLINAEQNLQTELGPNMDQMLEPNDANDLVYILDDGTQIRASQIHFDNDDPLVDLTAEKIPFVKYTDDVSDENDDNIETETKKINICESPVSRWLSKPGSPKCSFINSLPFKLVCNNTLGFEAQFTKYLEANTKTYATLNPVTSKNKSPNSLIKDNFKNYNESYRNDNLTYTREDILNMFKDSPMPSGPYEPYSERRHVRKTDPSRPVHKNWSKPISYIDIDGVLIGESENQTCFICGKHVDNTIDKLYLFDNEDQRLHRRSPQKKMSTQLKIICESCLNEYFKPSRMKCANQYLNPDEYLVIKNNQQYIFQKIKNFVVHYGKTINKIKKDEFVKFEIGSDGEIITRPIDNDQRSDDVIIVKDERKEGSSSDVEIIEPEPEIDKIIDNLEEADEEVKEFLGKYQCDSNIQVELKCRFCNRIFSNVSELTDHCETHKHATEDGEVFPCPLCDYGYANLKWLKGHLKAAHEKTSQSNDKNEVNNIKTEAEQPKSSPIATRTRSSIKKSDSDRKEKEKSVPSQNIVETKSELQQITPPMMNTEVKQEALDSSEDEIWIVQTADAEAPPELRKLIDAAQGGDNEKNSGNAKINKCFNCSYEHDDDALNKAVATLLGEATTDATVSRLLERTRKDTLHNQIFPSAESMNTHRCRKRGRKRKNDVDENLICIPTQEDFLKRAQGRLRPVANSADNNLLVVRSRKKRNKEPTSDPQILTCHYCNDSFTSKVRLKFHMQFHESPNTLTAEGLYSCAQCSGATFTTETAFFDHVNFQHHKHRRWHCPVDGCGKSFYLRATLTKHSRTHTDTRRYACDTCGKRFLDKQTLDEHGVTHLQIKPFQCHICLKQLTRRSRLRMHLRAHEEELAPTLIAVCAVCARAFRDHNDAQIKPFQCHICLKQLTRRSRLRMHLRAHEEELAPTLIAVCAVCARAFRDHNDAQDHALKSTECIEAFASEIKEETEEMTIQLSPTSGIVRHTVQIVESPKLSKPVARQVASPRAAPLLSPLCDEARALIRVVEVEKAFRCEYCEDVFYLEDGLNTHRAIHKNVKNPFTCHICKVSFATYSRCTTHKTTHGFYKRSLAEAKKQPSTREAGPSATGILGYGDFPVVKHFLCEDCGRSYLHWTYLQVHRRMKHINENFLYKCNQCELTFPNSWSLGYHRKKLHGKTGADEPGATSKIPKEDYRIPCRDCDEVLPNKTALYKHRKKEHSDSTICINSIGSDTGTSRQNITDHHHDAAGSCMTSNPVPAHSNRSHPCPVCTRSFRTLSMRNEHLRVHTGERPFPCDVCGVAFRRSTAMRNHRLIHTGVRAFACARCPKRFRIRSELRTHLRLKHPATLLVIQMLGLNPSSEEVMNQLAVNNIPKDKVIEITKMSFPKGTRSVVPDSARALASLSTTPRQPVTITPHQPQSIIQEQYLPVRRGRGIARCPRRLGILQRPEFQREAAGSYPVAVSVTGEELPELNVQLLLRDGVLVDGSQMVQLQLEDHMLME